MLKNYLKIALRDIGRHKGYTFINVAGLATGLATCLLIALFVQHKLRYDRFFPDADRTYRLLQTNEEERYVRTPTGLAQALGEHFPEVEDVTALLPFNRRLFARNEDRFYVDDVFHVDAQFFDVFPFALRRGHPETALDAPGRMVITQDFAEQLFGEADPIGQVLLYQNEMPYEVTGVLEAIPSNTHLRFNALLSLTDDQRAWRYGTEIQWQYSQDLTYAVLREDSDPAAFEQKLASFVAARRPDRLSPSGVALQPLTGIHLDQTPVRGELTPQSDVRYLYLFSAIAALILLIACINYMNLATARSAQRAREVGVRKTVGARRSQLMRQFLSESVLTALLALPLALVLIDLARPIVEHFAGETFVLPSWGIMGLAMLGIVLLVGLAGGSYPALSLSRFRPTQVLKGQTVGRSGHSGLFRQGLVVFQFAASILLALATLTTALQLRYMQSKQLGFDQEHVLTFAGYALYEQYDVLEAELLKQPRIQSVAFGPSPGLGRYVTTVTATAPEAGTEHDVSVLSVSEGYIETMGLEVVAGEPFLPSLSTDDEGAVVLNTSAVRLLGLEANPVGQRLRIAHRLRHRPDVYTVVGVVEDFHHASLHEPVRPVLFVPFEPNFVHQVLVRLTPGDLAGGVRAVEAVWDRLVPDQPLAYTFLDEAITRQYLAEQKLARLFRAFTTIALVLACLGLFGLAAYAAARRTKEIGIRKVLGASVTGIMMLLSKDFLRLILIAYTLAVPLTLAAMNGWLEQFAYRIEISWGIFLMAGLIALLVALLTVSYQAIRAALADPVKSLRYE